MTVNISCTSTEQEPIRQASLPLLWPERSNLRCSGTINKTDDNCVCVDDAADKHIDVAKGSQIDRGWAWVVLVMCITLQSFANGIILGIGVLVAEWLVYFDTSPSEISWIGSIASSLYLLGAPLASALCNRFSHRAVVMGGSLLCATGTLISGFMPTITGLYFSFGVLVGLGASALFAPPLMFVSHYFRKYTPVAMGLSSLGSALGPMVFAPLLRYLTDEYGWRGALVLTSCVLLQGGVLGALLCTPESLERRPRASRLADVTLNRGAAPTADNETPEITPEAKIKCRDRQIIDAGVGLENVEREASPGPRRSGIYELFDLDLLRSVSQLVLIAHQIAWNAGTFVWWLFLVDLALSMGFTGGEAAATVTLTTGCSALVRVAISGLMLLRPSFNPLHFISIAGLIGGTSSFALPHITNKVFFNMVCALCGISIGMENSALGVFVVQRFGVEKCTGAMSYTLAGAGLGAFIGPPIAGVLYDIGSSYENTFYFSGISFVVSTLILCTIYFKNYVTRQSKTT